MKLAKRETNTKRGALGALLGYMDRRRGVAPEPEPKAERPASRSAALKRSPQERAARRAFAGIYSHADRAVLAEVGMNRARKAAGR